MPGASKVPAKSPLKEGLNPSLSNFVRWLALYLVAVFLSGSFGFEVASATHGGDKGPFLSLISLCWAAIGWLPMAIILARWFRS
jgi:hypothetical protein